jgi:autoinducer 2-degrading protein
MAFHFHATVNAENKYVTSAPTSQTTLPTILPISTLPDGAPFLPSATFGSKNAAHNTHTSQNAIPRYTPPSQVFGHKVNNTSLSVLTVLIMSLCALLGALGHRVFSQKKVLSLSIPPVINMASMAGAASSAALTMVHVWVTPEKVEEFKAASLANHAESIKEPGNLRFDVIQDAADPCKFILYEMYESEEAAAAHKETAHYLKWRETVADMMAQPRQGQKMIVLAP